MFHAVLDSLTRFIFIFHLFTSYSDFNLLFFNLSGLQDEKRFPISKNVPIKHVVLNVTAVLCLVKAQVWVLF